MRRLTHNQLTEVREVCEQLGLTMDSDSGYLVVTFPNRQEQGLELFGEFVLRVDDVSMYWGLGKWFTKGARNVCHDPHRLEVRFEIAYGADTDILPNYRMHCTVCGFDSDNDARGFCGDCETCDVHCACEVAQ